MTLTQLEYLVAIDTYRSFGLAAEKSLVTQPTLSMQVKKLEQELGLELLDRSSQPILPTAAGRLVVEQARVVLREAGRIGEIVREQRHMLEGTLTLGIIPTVAPYLLPYFLGPFSKQYPDVRLEIRELTTGDIVSLLRRDLIDAGILATPVHEPGLVEEPVFYEEILLYVHPDHALASLPAVPAANLETRDMWMLTEGNCFRDQVINLCALGGNMPMHNLKYESGSIETLRKLVDVEGGFTLLPELAALELPVRESRRVRHFLEPVPMREISLVTVRSAAKGNLLARVREVMRRELPESLLDKSRGQLVEWK